MFVCPICGGTKYITKQELVGESGIGKVCRVTGYECGRCSVWFGDPKKFGDHRLFANIRSLPVNGD